MVTKYENIGKIIKDIRDTQKMSQMELALRAGYTNAYISRVELGYIIPRINGAEDILNAMGYKMSILIEPMEEKNESE